MIEIIKDKSVVKLQRLKTALLIVVIFICTGISLWFLLGSIFIPILLLQRSGIELDYRNNRYRYYEQFITKKGDWRSLLIFEMVVIKTKRGTRNLHHASTSTSKSFEYLVYEVYLMDSKKVKRLFINQFKRKTDAIKYADKLGKKINLEVMNDTVKKSAFDKQEHKTKKG